ncbi:hypothetical protein LWI29_031211 [Acer saccharum]|uniref:Phosphoglycerate kinase n=1 Tax=Acer saccharum TaxID=4024 RepID=A0AA39W0G1_ACESA|nr:hypothetical protein LWI29_031211 [Acer saccharum]
MASATAPTTFSLLKSAASACTSSSSSARASLLRLPASRSSGAVRLGFSAADPLFSVHVASRIGAIKGKATRGVVSMAKKSVGDLSGSDLKGKKVFVRADLNVPLDDNQNITDDTRIRAAIPTIKHLIQNGAKVILSSHLGRPKGVTPKFSLAPLVPRLSELLGINVVKADDCIGPEVEKLVASLPEGGVLLLENVRFYKEEEKNEPEFAKKLASLADLYVNDAFGTAHRAHASTEGVTKFLKPSVAGFLLQKELDYLVGAVSTPKRPFAAIVGGSKVSSKIGVIESLLEKQVCSRCNSKIVPASAIPDGWMGLDIGPDSIKTFNEALETTKTVIWNGPMGVFEFDKFAIGTEAIAKKLADLSSKGVTTIIGGGDSVAAVEKVGVAEVMSHISTGGGASLELLEGKELPGVIALDEAIVVTVQNLLDFSDLVLKNYKDGCQEELLNGSWSQSHSLQSLGTPQGCYPKYSLKPLVPRLSELLGIEVKMANDCIGEEVAKLVAEIPEGDLYVNDAFGTAHRAHASTEGVAKYLKPSVAGFLMQKELDYLVGAVANPKKPFAAIVGGSKVSSKIGVIESLLEKVDILLLGGGMIFTFYKAQGKAVGTSLVEEDKLDLATSLMEKAKTKGVSLLLPTDVVIADKFSPDANSKIVSASAIPDGWMGLDIGPDAIKTFNEVLDTTKTVIWNGPMGVFEFDKFAAGTESIAKKLADLSGKGVTTIIGGGDSVAAVEKAGLADKMSHISTGGGASLELLEGKQLPGVLALDDA